MVMQKLPGTEGMEFWFAPVPAKELAGVVVSENASCSYARSGRRNRGREAVMKSRRFVGGLISVAVVAGARRLQTAAVFSPVAGYAFGRWLYRPDV